MQARLNEHRRSRLAVLGTLGVAVALSVALAAEPPKSDLKTEFGSVVQPFTKKYCLDCHSTKAHKGGLDLERFSSTDVIRKHIKPWQQTLEMLEAGEMPPKGKPQPSAAERKQIMVWIRGFLDTEARARAGDPGHVPLRRLSNAEYDATIRDLTGVDLRPTREFPADGAGGEGFTNAAEALSDVSPALLTKYLNAAKDIADHAVFLPDGVRFSPGKTRRDWTDESTAHLRAFYAGFAAPDGKFSLQPYLAATVRHRDAILAKKTTLHDVALKEKIHEKYLTILWQTLTDRTPSQPLDMIRAKWAQASEKDVAVLAAEIAAWQTALWKVVPIGSYRYGDTRQVANDPAPKEMQNLRLTVKPAPGQSDVLVYLATHDRAQGKTSHVLWQRPRLEAAGKPTLLLRDYAQFGPAFELDFATLFGDTSKYLAAAAEVHQQAASADDVAKKHGLDPTLLARWIEVLALRRPDTKRPAVPLTLLDEPNPKNAKKPAINGWHRKGADLPVLVTNASDAVERIPGKLGPHQVGVHPTPQEMVGVTWKSPIAGNVRVVARVTHAHPACGNGVAWRLEHRQDKAAATLGEGAVDLGGEARVPEKSLKVDAGDLVVLLVDARDGNHVCDLTEIALTITETEKEKPRVWDLAGDIADSVLAGNPHADRHSNKETWSFVRGPAFTAGQGHALIPATSSLGRWREAASDPARNRETATLAEDVQRLFSGPRPANDKDSNRPLYDKLVAYESPLFKGVDVAKLAKKKSEPGKYGLDAQRFGKHPDGKPIDDASLLAERDSVTEVRLPAALLRERAFVVDAKLDAADDERLVQFQLVTTPPKPHAGWDGKTSVVGAANGVAFKRMIQGHADFRNVFPLFICFPHVVPTDEVVCLKMYHREDEPLARLFLDEAQKRQIDRLWEEHRFISRQPIAEYKYLPTFIGFVTQDQPKELVVYFEGQREPFRKRAEQLEKETEAAILKQWDLLLDFATRAYRRPLKDKEKTELNDLYRGLRAKEIGHDEAFRAVLARVLVAPAFLFRIEEAPTGAKPGLVTDWELATRLSYFLWSSAPDAELRRHASAGTLRDPKVLAEQTRRMLKDPRARSLAIEFGTQWIHVRGFDELKEKDEKRFPTFDAKLRQAMYEEAILFFKDLFENDRSVTQILDADYTFLNDLLAKHYEIPGIAGSQWRRVEGVRKYGRGGILGLGSVQAKQSGASRTSPVLRGNWVVETLLGEKLPRPPANVPKLPEEEGGSDKLTVRQLVEKHARAPECAVCHVRIDPFGYSLERYDTIGRRRNKDLGGLPIDARAKLKDGTEFEGIDGLRDYLLTKKKDVILRLFCQKLAGYALGRSATLSDQALVDEMMMELNRNDGRVSVAVLAIVASPQFRMIRGRDFED
jgi:hypothetical protein